jgi:hypothetical protein
MKLTKEKATALVQHASDFIATHVTVGSEPEVWPAKVPCSCGVEIEAINKNALVSVWVQHIVLALIEQRESNLAARVQAEVAVVLREVAPIVEFYLKREIESPSNHQEFAREAQEKLDKFRVALRADSGEPGQKEK